MTLKTLKDIRSFVPNENVVKFHIKEGAIKWVKYYKEKFVNATKPHLIHYYEGKFMALQEFHNITEEDLKEQGGEE